MRINIEFTFKTAQSDSPVVKGYFFPLKDDELEKLYQNLQLPNSVERTCSDYKLAASSPLWLENALGGASVNLMELNYLTKRLDSFDKKKMNTYVALVEKADLHDMTNLINMTFHSNSYTSNIK